jgi:hypothetical protein
MRSAAAWPLLILAAANLWAGSAAAQVIPPDQTIRPDQLARPRANAQKEGDRPELVLPAARRPAQPASANGGASAPTGSDAPDSGKGPVAGSGDPAVLAVELLQRLIAADAYQERESRAISAQWVALGEPGLRAARAGLALDEAAALVTAARTLAQSGGPADQELLRARLFDALPRDVPPLLLRALRQSAPGFFGADALVQLLDHQTATMRAAAGRELQRWVRAASEAPLEQVEDLRQALTTALGSRRQEARIQALELLIALDPAGAEPVLLAHLEDPTPRVALRAAQLCAGLPSETIAAALQQRAFATPALFRDQAYALLALMELEDRAGRSLVTAREVPLLLENLASSDPLASGVAACALAGVGFRGDLPAEGSSSAGEWLDLRVPHRLVAEVSASTFHQDLGSVADAARRRLSLISGVDYGADGPAWRGWWIEASQGFQARRAVLLAEPEQAPLLEVKLISLEQPAGALWLLGPDAPFDAGDGRAVRCLSAERSSALLEALRAQGLFSAQRLPIGQASGFESEELEVRIGREVKRFAFEADACPDWYRQAREAVLLELDQQRWQAYVDPRQHSDARSFFAAESPWWQAERSATERARRLAELCLGALPAVKGQGRGPYLAELERVAGLDLEGDSKLLGRADFEVLLRAIDDEVTCGARTEQLARLCLKALGANAQAMTSEQLDDSRRLLTHLWTLFGDTSLAIAGEVVASTGVQLARELVFEPESALRQLAAKALAVGQQEDDRELFRRLLSDNDFAVQAAAVRAAGDAQRQDLRAEIAMRARLGSPEVRCAALLALGQVGGPEALEAMIAGMSSEEPSIQAAAVSGLAQLQDPQSLPILASILDRGASGPLYPVAVEGLTKLGESAYGELLRLAGDPGSPGRRGAALILARASMGLAASALVDLLTADPRDREVLDELAHLTVVDLRGDLDPAEAYFEWLEAQATNDAFDWLRSAQDRVGLVPTPAGGLERGGTRAGAFSLWRGLSSVDALLAERSRRELERLLERSLEALPPRGPARDQWRQGLLSEIDQRWPG